MSSVKRSTLVSSSEHGQLKAPDKWETSPKTTNASATNTSEPTCDTMSSSAAAKTQTQQQSRDASKSSSSTQQVTKNLDLDDNLNLNDNELKSLLDEAYSYKGPKDKENKSEIFKELLHNVELEDQQKDTFYSSHHFRGSSRRPHTGGSLQDLVNEQLLESDYLLGPQSRRHQQNSRYTKNSSSVSSRQREGGSLPNNVNSSSCYPPVSSFSISKYQRANVKSSTKTKLDAHDYERSATNHHRTGEKVSYCDENQKSVASTSASVINANDKKHTIINIEDPEEARHLLAHDSLAQDTSEKHKDEGTELVQMKKQRIATMNYLSSVKDLGDARQNCHVDSPIHFLKYSSPTISDSSKLYTKSPIDPKYVPNRHVPLTSPQVAPNKLDENGNAILPKPTTIPLTTNPQKPQKAKRSNKADRNTTTWTVPQDSDYNIDSIVAFIENKEISKKTNIINVNKNNLSATERNRKEKKNVGNNKKEMNRLKKSTSMEELKSSSKIEEEIAQSERAQVSLRQKQMQNAQKRSTTSDNSKPSQLGNNKRGERRSWGTEELNDFETTEDRDNKKHKENKPNTKNNKKSEQFTSTNASIESIPTNVEAAEFHVVTKKKKTKKRQILEEAKAKQQQMNQRDSAQSHGRSSNSTATSGGNKYQPSSTYTNDRDIYVNSLMTKENRRKSTSSVPPSDKSDSSDLDSVHSLPIESTTTCTSSSIISYAEMARKANQPPEKFPTVNCNAWPSVSQNGKNSESPENSNISTSSSTVSSRSHGSNKSYDTIKTSSPSEEKSLSNLNDSRVLDTPKLGEYVKNQLQKSKSCDSEKYTTTMSMDQFPGLEKTVKPQKSHPNFASVLTSPPPLPTSTASTPAPLPAPTTAPVFPPTTAATASEKQAKGPTSKKSPTPSEANAIQKENAIKTQQSIEEKVDNEIIVDANCAKLQFVQNSAKAEEIANSDSSNLFAPINMKKTKKSQPNVITAQRTARQTAVIFSDRETNHENVSPLLFGDFNDDILQLMKQEENHVGSDTPNGPMSITDSSASNCTNAFESADNHAIYDCNQSKPNIHTPMMSSQSDPGYASAHRTTVPTESHEVVDNHHQIHTENHVVENSTITELSSRKSNVTKKTTLNKINVNNNKNSDVVSNQSLNNNNNMLNNNVSVGDATAKVVSVSQTISDSDSLNNNINIQMNDKIRNYGVDGDAMKAQQQQKPPQQQQHNDAGVTKPFNAQNNVHNTVSKTGNQPAANYQQQKGIITHDSVNKSIDNISNGSKMIPTSNKLSSTENEVVPVNSHPANVPQKSANFAEPRVPFVTHNHNHNDIVHFVGSAWEEVKFGRAHYFSGQ